jgi:phage gp46-like protein
MDELAACLKRDQGNRRIFWTTRLVCGDYTVCGHPCSIPGLEYEDQDDPEDSNGIYRTINNDEWLRSLILNILNTRARNDVRCPPPTAVYGHWSESYRDDGLYIGTRLWNVADKSYRSCLDEVKAIGAAVQADMGKLVALGIATSVKVEAVYHDRTHVDVIVQATTTTGSSRIDLSGAFVSESWIWH